MRGGWARPRIAAWPANTFLLYLLFGAAFFLPTLRGAFGTAGAIIVNGGILLLCFCVAVVNRFRIPLLDRSERILFGLVALSLVYYLVAISGATALLSDRVILRDAFELHKPLLHFSAFATAFVILRRESDLRHLERILALCFGGILVLTTIQYVGLAPIGWLYTKDRNVLANRLTVPFGNPYDFAFAVSFFCYLYLFRYLTERRVVHLTALALAMIAIVLSQSRTNAIVVSGSLAISVPLVLAVDSYRSLLRLRVPLVTLRFAALFLLVMAAGYAAYLAYYEELRYLIGGLERLAIQRSQSSLDERVRQFGVVVGLWEHSSLVALFGNGISKSSMDLLESAYVFYLFRYGIIGILLIFLLPLLVGIGTAAAALGRKPAQGKVVVMAALVWFLSLFVASVGNSFTEMPRLSFLYYFMIGFVLRYYTLTGVEHRMRPIRGNDPNPSPTT